jgi:hypothetical protein
MREKTYRIKTNNQELLIRKQNEKVKRPKGKKIFSVNYSSCNRIHVPEIPKMNADNK